MASILTAHIRKSYKPIEDLEPTDNNDLYYLNTPFCEGTIHSVYARLDYADYRKIYDYYNEDGSLDQYTFIFYSNNNIGVLCYSKPMVGSNYCEKWRFRESVVYNYKDVDVAYVIDKFTGRAIPELHQLNDVSLRFNSCGNWCNLDGRLSMFIGKRLIYEKYQKNMEFISQNARVNVPDLDAQPGVRLNPLQTMDVREDYYVMFRLINHEEFSFNNTDIKNLLRSQKLYQLIDPNVNLLEPFPVVP